MPRLIFTASAVADLQRLRLFLAGKNPVAARRATKVIREHLELLLQMPEAGRPLPLGFLFRELVIPFGDSGYIARYRLSDDQAEIYILAVRHQKEVGY